MSPPATPDIPEAVRGIADRLEGAGFEAWCVGGAIRDQLLGERGADFDLATSATPDQVRRLFRRTVDVGAEFGTIGVLDDARALHEVTTFRRDVSTDGRRAVVAFGVSLDEDLARRDFTINAIAFRPRTGEWRDPFGGFADLDARVVRAVGVAAERFREDYLRILRGVRFAARFDFALAPETWEAARANASGLSGLSAERVREEWFKSLRTTRSLTRLLELWRPVIAGSPWMPGLVPSPPREPADLPRDPVLLTAFLVRDAAETLERLRASRAEIERVAAIEQGPAAPRATDALTVRRWLSGVTPGVARDLLTLAQLSRGEEPAWGPVLREIVDRGDPVTRGDLALSGRDLVASGVPQGPEVGRILGALLDWVLEDPARNSREALIGRAKEIR